MKFSIFNNRFFYIFLFFITIILNLVGTIAGKYIGKNLNDFMFLAIWILVLIFSLLSRTVTMVFLNRKFKLSYIYPILSLNYLLSLIAGKLFFNESITFIKISGTVIIVLGVILTTFSKEKFEGYQL